MIRYLNLTLIILLTSCFTRTDNPKICIYTQQGKIYAELYQDKAELTVNNFLKYIEKKSYDSSLFYRTVKPENQPYNKIKIEVIQGGFKDDNSPKMLTSIQHEPTNRTGILHLDGTLSMARNDTGTVTSEFFICIGKQPELDYGGKRNPDGQGFAAFGKIYNGMDIVKNIQQMKDTNQYLVEPVYIDSIRRIH